MQLSYIEFTLNDSLFAIIYFIKVRMGLLDKFKVTRFNNGKHTMQVSNYFQITH